MWMMKKVGFHPKAPVCVSAELCSLPGDNGENGEAGRGEVVHRKKKTRSGKTYH